MAKAKKTEKKKVTKTLKTMSHEELVTLEETLKAKRSEIQENMKALVVQHRECAALKKEIQAERKAIWVEISNRKSSKKTVKKV